MTRMKSQTLTIGELLGMMMFKVYYTDPVDDKSYGWNCTKLTDALSTAELFRTKGMGFVTMVSEDPDHVGKSGVDEVTDPNYDGWISRRHNI